MAAKQPRRYRLVTPERRAELERSAGAFKWAILFAVVAALGLMLMHSQQQQTGRPPRIRAGHADEREHCHDKEDDYGYGL